MKLTGKQEKFCQVFVETGNATEAYRASYSTENMKNETVNEEASRLRNNPKLSTRIEEIKKEHRLRHNITVDDLLDELEESRITALNAETPQSSAAVSATMGKAKLLGLDKQILDLTSTDGTMSPQRARLTDDQIKDIAQALKEKV